VNPRHRHVYSERPATLSANLDKARRDQIKALVGCPKCRAEAGHGCKVPSGTYTKMHTDRVFAGMRDPRFTW
jgi:hypothetical protein